MLQPIATQRLYQQVASRIEDLIASGKISAGKRLPSEKELARQLGVSRPTIREAMIALEISGLVEVRTGSGIYVSKHTPARAIILDSGPGPFELLNARLLIEGEIAANVAVLATPEDVQEIGQTIEEMERVMEEGGHGRDADQAFHKRIASVMGNSVLTGLVETLWSNMFNPMFTKLSERTGLLRNQEATVRDHKAILAAIATGDALGARTAMRQHLLRVKETLSGEHESASVGAADEARTAKVRAK
ncbi:MAG TPA: FadR/GntR family transcriptional regulator [Acidisarcina sp.]|nr:FadR/GntR family transcriptional regulator [Acidisarcina sp.]